jgi:hypothetical protein
LQRLLTLRRPSIAAWPVMLLRNVSFFVVVLAHLIRRVLPPW